MILALKDGTIASVRSRIVLTLSLTGVVAALVGCGGSDTASSGKQIVAAFYPLAFAAERISPDATVTNLTPAGAEPHDLELSARDVELVETADAVFYLGSSFMPALEAVAENASAFDLLEGLELLEGGDGHGHGEEEHSEDSEHDGEEAFDPHVWLDPMRLAAMTERMAEELGDPDAADALVAELTELDDELRAGLERCERRTIVTSHAAFGYLAEAYGLEQIALTGITPETEPSAKAIEALVQEVEEEGATTVFFETLVSPDLAETVAREAGATTAVLNPLEGLTDDEIDAGADYFSVMRENLDALRTALGCS
jgi:zinc transport system substrate-binding protein